jgi:catechol 2,3-dioxygenase-like lactoylglutathione lyase family enzyme
VKIKYRHLNIVASDWRKLATFYERALDCERVPPERDLSGPWIERAVGVEDARISGVHVRLPGHGDHGSTIEILQYAENQPRPATRADREGFGHIAFEVDDVEAVMKRVLEHGGSKVGDIASGQVEGTGQVTLVYLADPEGNIVELQSWR